MPLDDDKQRLFGTAARRAAEDLLPLLGDPDRHKLNQILELSTSDTIVLASVLNELYPDVATQKAQKSLTNLKGRINGIAEEHEQAFRLMVDRKTRSTPEQRNCWFVGENRDIAEAERYSDELTRDVEGSTTVPARGIATSSQAMAEGKRNVRFFVSYAHEKPSSRSKAHEQLIEDLRTEFTASKNYALDVWIDRRIQVGHKWHEQIQQAIKDCDFGVFLISPAFLGSEYITDHELPHFISPSDGRTPKPVIPIGLQEVDFDRQDLKGLLESQIFLGMNVAQQFYSDISGRPKKRKFAHELYLQIERRLDEYFAQGQNPTRATDSFLHGDERPNEELPDEAMPEATPNFTPTRGHSFEFGESEAIEEKQFDPSNAKDALDELHTWAVDDQGSPFFAVLGEYGIGKTTTLKQFTRRLLELRKADKSIPLPIYVDLRAFVSNDARTKDHVPTIQELLNTVIERSWKLTDKSITADVILRLVQEKGAIILFDGLDEKIVHMTRDRAQAFIRTLWSVLPNAADAGQGKASAKQKDAKRGKLLISCRSHYFRDVGSQNSMLVGEDREHIDRKTFPALLLLPFTEEQILAYLTAFLECPDRATEAMNTIRSIHNLMDLAPRAYLLTQITAHLDELEVLQLKGETVNAARLYELFIKSWLNRDDGKHQLDAVHKRELMEELAASLWRSEEKTWDADTLEKWLDRFLVQHPEIAGAYIGRDRAVLKEDLRTATFVVRPDDDQNQFRFAHTSLQEFFLASYLVRALKEERPDDWDLPVPSNETLDFVGQLLQLEFKAASERTLNDLPASDNCQQALVAFHYWMRALPQEFPVPKPERVNLEGANLEGRRLGGTSPQPLRLPNVNLRNAKLNRARLTNVILADADLTHVQARDALFRDVSAINACCEGIDFSGLRWKGGSLSKSTFQGQNSSTDAAEFSGCQLLDVDLTDALLPSTWPFFGSAVQREQRLPMAAKLSDSTQTLNVGHTSSVSSCVFSPDGTQVVSGSDDQTLKLWNVATGECLRTFHGHSNGINSCVFSPDGTQVVSGSFDRTLKLWNVATGECLRTFNGHSNGISSCVFSPDGTQVVSGSYDQTLKLWNVATGECLRIFHGHTSSVLSCVFSPDGTQVVSGSYDQTLKLWNVATGECLRTFNGHTSSVTNCVFSPDGTQVVSASFDRTLKLWNVATGECLRTFHGHTSLVTSCVFSPDGTQVVSGSFDQTLKLWNVATGECLRTFNGHTSSVTSCVFSPDGTQVVSGSSDQTLKLWNVATGECLRTFHGHTSSVLSCVFSPDGTQVVSGSSDQTLKLWNVATGECLRTFHGHTSSVLSCVFSPDGTQVVSGSDDHTLKLWNVATGEYLRTFHGHTSSVLSCVFSPDGTQVVSGSSDQTLKLWNVATGECLRTLHGHTSSVLSCVFSPDGTQVVSGSDDQTLKLWNVATGECLRTFNGHTSSVTSCVFSPDGTQVVSGSYGKALKLWNVAMGECLRTFHEHTNQVSSCVFSPDGTQVVSGSYDQTLKLWNVATGECLRTFHGHTNAVNSCLFSPDGTQVVSGSSDQTLKLWNVATGECLRTFANLPEGETMTFDQDGGIQSCSPDAWRFLGWRWTDPDTQRQRLLPAEFFGPLPVYQPT